MSTTANFYPALEWLYVYDNAALTGTLDITAMPAVVRVHADDCNLTTFVGSATANYYTAIDRLQLFNNNNLTGTLNISNMPTIRLVNAYNCDLTTLNMNLTPN